MRNMIKKKKKCLLFKYEKNNQTLSNDWPTYCQMRILLGFLWNLSFRRFLKTAICSNDDIAEILLKVGIKLNTNQSTDCKFNIQNSSMIAAFYLHISSCDNKLVSHWIMFDYFFHVWKVKKFSFYLCSSSILANMCKVPWKKDR